MEISVYVDSNRCVKDLEQKVKETARFVLRWNLESLRSLHIHLQDALAKENSRVFQCRIIANFRNSPPCILCTSGRNLEEVVTRTLFKVQNYAHGDPIKYRTDSSKRGSPKEAA